MNLTRRIVAALLGALIAGALVAPAAAVRNDVLRVPEGSTTATAITLSQETFDSATTVLIGRADLFADSLASGGLQGTSTPLLLTDSDGLAAAVEVEIARLGATDAIVLGGTAAISDDVVDDLEALGLDVTRREGATRLETAIDVAGDLDGTTALLVRAFPSEDGDDTQAFADSIAAGAWAAENGWPVLFTQTEVLSGSTRDFLAASDLTNVHVIGGTAAISDAVTDALDALGLAWDRVAGPTRFDTAVAIAAARGYDDEDDADAVVLVEGQDDDAWAAGFAAAAFAAANDAPLLLSNGNDLPEVTEAFLVGPSFAVDEDAISGTVLVCAGADAACDEATAALGLPTDAVVTITSGELDPGGTVTGTVDDGGQGAEFEVEGCGIAQGTDLTLAPDDSFAVQIGADQQSDCTLTITISFGNGTVQTETATIEVASSGDSQSGVVIAEDDAGNSYSFVTGAGDTVMVTYDGDDRFQIGGTTASVTAWEAASAVGNLVTFTNDTTDDDLDTHNLTDTAPYDSGIIGNVNTATGTLDFIEPTTDTILRTALDYTGSSYRIGGSTSTEVGFEDDVNEGDSLTIQDDGGVDERFDLTNRTLTGIVGDIVSSGATMDFTIDGLGDNPVDATDDTFQVSSADTFTGGADNVTEFSTELTAGDTVAYSRANGVQTVNLTNSAPPTLTGLITESVTPGADTLVYLPTSSATRGLIDYSGVSDFRLGGAIVTEAEAEAALFAGAGVELVQDNPDTGADEARLSVTPQDLSGLLEDFQTGANTLDVANSAGGTIADDLSFTTSLYSGGEVRHAVSGVGEVALSDFKLAIAEDADANSTITAAPITGGLGTLFTFTA